MKKKPIYLWVLLVLSAINSALAVVGIFTPVPSKDALRASQENVGTLSAQQIEDAVNYAHQVSESSHSIFNTILIILSAFKNTSTYIYNKFQCIVKSLYFYL